MAQWSRRSGGSLELFGDVDDDAAPLIDRGARGVLRRPCSPALLDLSQAREELRLALAELGLAHAALFERLIHQDELLADRLVVPQLALGDLADLFEYVADPRARRAGRAAFARSTSTTLDRSRSAL